VSVRSWAAILFAIVVVGCGGPPAGLVARSDLGEVTRQELDTYILEQPEARQRPGSDDTLSGWRRSMVESLLVDRALDVDVEQAAVTAMTNQQQVDEARRRVLLAAFEAETIDKHVRVEAAEVRSYYDENPDQVGHPEQIRLRHIFRRVARDAPAEVWEAKRSEMEALLERLRSGAHFGALARQYSDSETASLDGLIGRLSRGAIDPRTEELVWNLDEGEISEVYETPVGFHIFRLDNHLPAEHQPFEEVKGQLEKRLQNEERERLVRETFAELLAESNAGFHPELLAGDGPVDPNAVLFVLGDDVITGASVEAYRQRTPFVTLRIVPADAWLEEQARTRLFLWKAEQTGLASRPEVARELEAAGRDVLRRQALERRVHDHIVALDAEGKLRRHYDEHAMRFQLPKKVHLRLVEVTFKEQEPPYPVRERLERLVREIREGRRDMAEVARELSDDPSASAGGDVGWIMLDGVGIWAGPTAQKAVAGLAVGELSEPLLVERYDQSTLTYSREGYVIIRKEGEDEPEPLTFEDAWFQVADSYREVHRDQLMANVRREILKSIHAAVFEENL
jgi:parvulin-like peptidyl-prolyl isomerase